MIQLSNLVELRETVAAKELTRFNQLRSATVIAALAPGYTIGQALEHFEATAREVLPDNFRFDYSGPSREFKQAGSSILLIFGLALAFIYLLLAAQFESFLSPLADHGYGAAVDGRRLPRHAPHRRHAQRLQPDRAGHADRPDHQARHPDRRVREQGLGRGCDAARRRAAGGELRLRPILMTTAAMVLGAVPLALAHGAGAESRQQIGWVIVGGMSLGTLLTLFVLPALYAALPAKRAAAGGAGVIADATAVAGPR